MNEIYAKYQTTLEVINALAPEIAQGINKLNDLLSNLAAKKEATRQLIENLDIDKVTDGISSCEKIANQSRILQDSLQKTYCKLQNGSIKGLNKNQIKSALDNNIAYMNDLGPILAECSNTSFTPWQEIPCKGPCVDNYYDNITCLKKLQVFFKATPKTIEACDKKLNNKYLAQLAHDAIADNCGTNIDDDINDYTNKFGDFCDIYRFAFIRCLSQFPCVGTDETNIINLLKTCPASDGPKIMAALNKDNFLETLYNSVDENDNNATLRRILADSKFSMNSELNQLKSKGEIPSAQIKKYREIIASLPSAERAKWYLELQKHVPYHSQRDNQCKASGATQHNMCTITSLAMNFEALGVSNPYPEVQFEDGMGEEEGYPNFKNISVWGSLAESFNLRSSGDIPLNNNKSTLISKIKPELEKGNSISLTLYPYCRGHIVRVQGIDSGGLWIDDPYGNCPLKCKLYREKCGKNSYQQYGTTPDGGNNNYYSWDELKQITIRNMVVFSNK